MSNGERGYEQKSDVLSYCLFGISIALSFSIIFMNFASMVYQHVTAAVSTVIMVFAIVRMLRNSRKQKESGTTAAPSAPDTFDIITARLKGAYLNLFRGSREFKYFVCPNCRQTLRIPKKKGAVRIICAKCDNKFTGNT